MVTKVNKVLQNGEIKEFCFFENDFLPEYNMLTLCMQVHKNNNITNERERSKFADKIIKSGKHIFFEYEEDVYITRIK